MLPATLTEPATAIAAHLKERGESIAVVESSAGGLVSAALLAVPGASAYYRGGVVIYTLESVRGLLSGQDPPAKGTRSSTEPFAAWLAGAVAGKLNTDWGFGETGAAGPSGNPYGDPAGHAWVAVRTPGGGVRTEHVLTGDADREANMEAFAAAGLRLLLDTMSG